MEKFRQLTEAIEWFVRRRLLYFFTHERCLALVDWLIVIAVNSLGLLVSVTTHVLSTLYFGTVFSMQGFEYWWGYCEEHVTIVVNGVTTQASVAQSIAVMAWGLANYAVHRWSWRHREQFADVLYRLLYPYFWVVLHMLVAWQWISLHVYGLMRSVHGAWRNVKWSLQSARTEAILAGRPDPVPFLWRFTPTLIVACGIGTVSPVLYMLYGVWGIAGAYGFVTAFLATEAVQIHERYQLEVYRRSQSYLS